MPTLQPITEFTGRYRFLSNFYPARIITDGEERWPTVEHAFQGSKTLYCWQRDLIREARSPGLAKKMGRTVWLRQDWDNVKDEVMYDLVSRKFGQSPQLGGLLVDTGKAQLIEGNTWGDTYWGVCRGRGQNKLGLILMRVRDELTEMFEESAAYWEEYDYQRDLERAP